MEADQNYEYDAPKWFDFNAENEFDDDLSLDDSWFEREHPLHEPKDPSIHSAAVKPLISGFQGSKTESSKTKPQGKKLIKKDFNSKKSLGLNTIRTQRGQHKNDTKQGRAATAKKTRKTPSQNADQQVSVKDERQDSNGSVMGDGRNTPDEILHNESCNFTPPWSVSPTQSEELSQESFKDESLSILKDDTVFSPSHTQLSSSPMSPMRVRSLKSSNSSTSPSPKSSLLHKAVTGACHLGPRRRRRLLPAIPSVKSTNAKADEMKPSPDLCSSHAVVDELSQKTRSICDSDKPALKETGVSKSMKPLRATDTHANIEASNHPFPQKSSECCKDDKNTFSGYSLSVIPESDCKEGSGSIALASRECEKQKSSKWETGQLSNDKSIEKLLKMHNKKIVSAKSQYDENGRRIKTSEPNFCPAPAKNSSASPKRSASTGDKPVVSAKQKRRSCMASVTSAQSELSKRKNTVSTSSRTNMKGKDYSNQQTTKQKRRSCMASLQNIDFADTVDNELRELIAQHNSRVNAAAK
ncbi:uncharacterized protein [Acropora muricata]|uniref:uncharacterized protein n=1 Tax=Acropora muricata TaxID=159855 RepID=UPI0034E589BA